MKLEILMGEDLTQVEQNELDIDPDDMEEGLTGVARITYDDGSIHYLTDRMEPEDVSLMRDLQRFISEIERAHQKGFEAGFKEANHIVQEDS